MQVVLNQDVQGTGKKGQLVEVSAGYARNYLFPKNIASPATNSAINEINTRTSAAEHHKALELEDAKNISAALDGKKVV
ncbi:MAG: 50S ribosomal protein L9, partial [Oscillospiraceae bacterium]